MSGLAKDLAALGVVLATGGSKAQAAWEGFKAVIMNRAIPWRLFSIAFTPF